MEFLLKKKINKPAASTTTKIRKCKEILLGPTWQATNTAKVKVLRCTSGLHTSPPCNRPLPPLLPLPPMPLLLLPHACTKADVPVGAPLSQSAPLAEVAMASKVSCSVACTMTWRHMAPDRRGEF